MPLNMDDLETIIHLHDTKKIGDREAIKRVKALNKRLTEHSLDPDILAGIPDESNHVNRNKLTHWRQD